MKTPEHPEEHIPKSERCLDDRVEQNLSKKEIEQSYEENFFLRKW